MDPDSFVQAAVVVLVVAAIAVALFRHFGLGSILGLLVTGVLIGPYTPGPAITNRVDELRHFTELGVVLLLFVIGLEMQPRRLWEMRHALFGLGTAQVLLSGLGLTIYFGLLLGTWPVALLIGLGLALSSTALVMQYLYERGEIASPHGQTAFAILLLQDLAVVPMLALLPVLASRGPLPAETAIGWQLAGAALMLGLLVVLGRWVMPWVLEWLARQYNREAFFLVVMAAVFVAAWAMDLAGMSMALGAFLLGMMLSESRFNVQIHASVEPHKGLLMSLFFIAVGMSVDPAVVAAEPFRFLDALLALLVIKAAVLYWLCRRFGSQPAEAARVAFLLAQAGEFGFILFGAAKLAGLMDDALFVQIVALISLSMLLTPLLAHFGTWAGGRIVSAAPPVDAHFYYQAGRTGATPPRVIIAGYGRVGHTIGAVLAAHRIPYVAFDANPVLVARWRSDGYPVFYGDIRDPHLLSAARVDQAQVVVLTLDDQQATLAATSLVRGHAPGVIIVARARDLVACDALFRAGASKAFPEAVEASLRLATETLEGLGISDRAAEAIVDDARGRDYAQVRSNLDAVPVVPPVAATDAGGTEAPGSSS
ncbi:MAG: portal protein [Chromatiaceae bacterium]|nr:MAG: portal protein [Chromatiaceae bacterium]